MGVDLNQLQQAFRVSKQYSDVELSEAEKRISALLQALYEVIQGNYKDPFQIEDGVGIQDTSVGHIMAFMGTKVPKHYLACDGAVLNIEDYPALSQHMIDNFGSVNHFGGDGTTTFAVPDLRGEFLRGAGMNSHTHQGSGSNVGGHQNATKLPYIYSWRENSNGAVYGGFQTGSAKTYTPQEMDYNFANGNRVFIVQDRTVAVSGITTEFTVRPTNTSILYCIKYEPTFYLKVGPDAMTIHREETRIGTWYDGKPLYRRYVNTIGSVGSEIQVSCVIENLDKVVHIDGYCYCSSGQWATTMDYTAPGSTSGMACWYDYKNRTVHFQHSGSYAGQSGHDVAELWYTKTKTI